MNYKDFPYIYEQYSRTNLSQLLQGIGEIKANRLNKPLEAIKSDLMDLKTAKGNALDEWGKLLNFSRFIPLLTREQYELWKNDFYGADYEIFFKDRLNTFCFFDCNFDELTFALGSNDLLRTNYATLDDDNYRELLHFIYLGQNLEITAENLKLLLDDFFKLSVSIVEKNMEFIVYYFIEILPVYLKVIFLQYDLIPRPAGVNLEFKQGFFRYFGFQTNDKDYNMNNLGNFNSSIFNDD